MVLSDKIVCLPTNVTSQSQQLFISDESTIRESCLSYLTLIKLFDACGVWDKYIGF